MEKLKLQTHNIVDENIKKIAELFPNCLTERLDENGKPEAAIDFDMLRQELSKDIVEGPAERYQFTWPDKRNAIRLANAPTTDTLRPCREESVDFDNTQNLYIEGDNLEVLKLLRENYLGKVKMIYIDPPYNTGNDFVYNDRFRAENLEFRAKSGNYDEEGNLLTDVYTRNTESNGRFHTDWLNMIYPRLKVAKDLLSEDGVIFISIDDHEVENLKKVCNEVFGESNFKSQIAWQKRYTRSNNTIDFTTVLEHILVYSRTGRFVVNLLPRTDEADNRYTNPDNDPRGPWKGASFLNPATPSQRPNLCYPITNPNTGEVTYNTDHAWRRSKDVYEQLQSEEKLYWGIDGKAKVPSIKMFLSEARGLTPINFWDQEYAGNTDNGSVELFDLMQTKVFDFPKPVKLLKRVLEHGTFKNSLILDFFSGSATTAHAVMQLNAEDGGNRKFIMVQLPEATDEKSEAYKAGYKNICEIGKERIRRAGKKIKEESPLTTQNLDTGFRVLKLDSSNMQDVYYCPEDSTEQTLFEDNIKPDRSSEDLLFQVMLECNLPLSAKIETEKIAGKEVFSVNEGYLIACFDEKVNEDVIKEVAKRQPYYFVMRDSSLATDNVADNFEQIWMAYSKDTIRRII